MIGQTISHYKITEKLGQGGMGVVYKAQDTKLRRTVALKFLRSEATEDADAKARFLREAQAAAALDHENVCTVHEIDEADGQTFLSMAYLEGETVREKTKTRPLKIEEALDIAIQTALGLQAAHEKEIVHRDIKSANLMVTPRGQVKIMDFGLAQLAEQSRLTKTAMILGTPAYMSPEQARREPTDRRTDIWSLGVVIYEMVTGKLPFEGEREEAVAYAIVHEEPEAMTAQRVDVPVELDRVVNKTLAKDPGERYPHVEDLLVDLRALQKKQESGSGRPVPAPAVLSRGRRTGWYAAAAAVVVAGLAGVTWIGIFETGSQVPAEPMRLVPLTSYPGLEYHPDFSPDGEQVTFSWNGEKQDNFDIYVRPVDSDNPQRLTTHAAVEERPAWSPDGRWIAFERSERPPLLMASRTRSIDQMETGKSSILLIPSIGGPERKVTVVERFKRSRLAWLPDSTGLIIADGNPSSLFTVSIETGEKRQLTKPPEGMWGDVDPVLSADAHSLAFVRFNRRWFHDAYLLDLDAEFKPLGAATPLTSHSQAFVQAWSPDEQDLIVSRSVGHSWGYLHRVSVAGAPNELRRLDVVGSGVDQAAVSAGRNRMVCVRESKDWDLEVLEKTGAESDSWDPASFPSSTRLEAGPRYSPDGKWLAFESNRTGPFGIWLSAADGTGAREVWTVENAEAGMPRWSPDSQRIAFDAHVNDNFDIYIISSAGGSPLRLTDHPGQDMVPSWSADGRWIYFTSNRSGRLEIWKVSAAGGEPRQVTSQGGIVPFESPDGQFVYYLKRPPQDGIPFSGYGSLWRTPTGGGEPSKVLERVWARNYALTPRGIYFLAEAAGEGTSAGFAFRFLDLESGEIRTEVILPPDVAPGHTFAISPDERTLLYTRFRTVGADLVLVENFR